NESFSEFPKKLEALDKYPGQVPFLYVGALVLVGAIGYALYQSRVRLISNGTARFAWQPDYPGVEFPPRGSSTIVNRPWPGLLATMVVLAALGVFAKTCQRTIDGLHKYSDEESHLLTPVRPAMVR